MAEQTITLIPGESKLVDFEAIPREARTYRVSVDSLAGSFSVTQLAVTTGYMWYGINDVPHGYPPTSIGDEMRLWASALQVLGPGSPVFVASFPTKEEVLAAISDPRNSFYRHVTHGLSNLFATYDSLGHPTGYIVMEQVKEALEGRAPFRFCSINNCYADMTPPIIENGEVVGYAPPWPWIFTKNFEDPLSVAITLAGNLNEGSALYNTPEKLMINERHFRGLLGDPANWDIPLSELWRSSTYDLVGAPAITMRFWGSHTATPRDIFRR